jgi:hypothetical protein
MARKYQQNAYRAKAIENRKSVVRGGRQINVPSISGKIALMPTKASEEYHFPQPAFL